MSFLSFKKGAEDSHRKPEIQEKIELPNESLRQGLLGFFSKKIYYLVSKYTKQIPDAPEHEEIDTFQNGMKEIHERDEEGIQMQSLILEEKAVHDVHAREKETTLGEAVEEVLNRAPEHEHVEKNPYLDKLESYDYMLGRLYQDDPDFYNEAKGKLHLAEEVRRRMEDSTKQFLAVRDFYFLSLLDVHAFDVVQRATWDLYAAEISKKLPGEFTRERMLGVAVLYERCTQHQSSHLPELEESIGFMWDDFLKKYMGGYILFAGEIANIDHMQRIFDELEHYSPEVKLLLKKRNNHMVVNAIKRGVGSKPVVQMLMAKNLVTSTVSDECVEMYKTLTSEEKKQNDYVRYEILCALYKEAPTEKLKELLKEVVSGELARSSKIIFIGNWVEKINNILGEDAVKEREVISVFLEAELARIKHGEHVERFVKNFRQEVISAFPNEKEYIKELWAKNRQQFLSLLFGESLQNTHDIMKWVNSLSTVFREYYDQYDEDGKKIFHKKERIELETYIKKGISVLVAKGEDLDYYLSSLKNATDISWKEEVQGRVHFSDEEIVNSLMSSFFRGESLSGIPSKNVEILGQIDGMDSVLKSIAHDSDFQKNPLHFLMHSSKMGHNRADSIERIFQRIDYAQLNESVTYIFLSKVAQYRKTSLLNIVKEVVADEELWESIRIRVKNNRELGGRLVLLYAEIPLLFTKRHDATFKFLCTHFSMLAPSVQDLSFYNGLIGAYGTQALEIMSGFKDCLMQRVLHIEQKQLVMEFTRRLRVLSPGLMRGYIHAKKNHQEDMYMSELNSLAENITGKKSITQQQREKPYYKDMIKAVYQNNAGSWTSYENNATCRDRTEDIARFHIREGYEIDTLGAGNISLKQGTELNKTDIDKLKQNILNISAQAAALEYDQKKLEQVLVRELDDALQQLIDATALDPSLLDELSSVEDKIMFLCADEFYGHRILGKEALKRLCVLYEFALFEDVRAYIQGTSDRVGKSSNQEYALLCELHTFFKDRMKESARKIIENSWSNPRIAYEMQYFFEKVSADRMQKERQRKLHSLQVEKLGLTEGFLYQVKKKLEHGGKKNYTLDQVKDFILRYEKMTKGFIHSLTTSKKGRTKAIYGMLRSQKMKTIEAEGLLSGNNYSMENSRFSDFTLSLLQERKEQKDISYNSDQFAEYTFSLMGDLFSTEEHLVDSELEKFVSEKGEGRKTLMGYIDKSQETAHARMVGGVCVSGDNPAKDKMQNLWDMPNYFQMVLQDPESKRCVGLILLHHFVTEQGEKVLSASMNPSSTYLYTVDEAALFRSLTISLEIFAKDNDFDKIILSKEKEIRTNRTGGGFEQAMNQKIKEVGEVFHFDQSKVFSYHPSYTLQNCDVIWKKE